MSEQKQVKPWYKHIWPWVLMAGPIFVVIASVAMFFVAKEHATDLVTDDYYKDGKHIDIQLHRDEEAVKRHMQVQVLISPDKDAAKVFVSGEFDPKQPLNLLLMHPTKNRKTKPSNCTPSVRKSKTVVWSMKQLSNPCRRPTTGICAWKTLQAFGGWRING